MRITSKRHFWYMKLNIEAKVQFMQGGFGLNVEDEDDENEEIHEVQRPVAGTEQKR